MKQYKKIIATMMALLIAAMSTGCGANSDDSGSASVQPENTQAEQLSEKTTSNQEVAKDATKDETVYVLAHADGSTRKIIVSDRLSNPSGAGSILDVSTLTDILNVKGDEPFTADDKDLTWAADGADISYQGESTEALPVGVKVSYTLDGKEISAEDLAGKSGKVTMRFDYENNRTQTVNIGGKDVTICVPFLMATGMLLDNAQFTNIEVENGTVVTDGERSAVLGFGMPGLQDSLGLDALDLDVDMTFPESMQVTADVTNFSLTTTLTVATNSVFAKLDTEKLDSASDLEDAIDKLCDATNQLMDGSSQLYDGIDTLFTSTDTLTDGIAKLLDGAQTLSGGTETLDAGTAQLSEGAGSLKTGAGTLAAGAKTCADGTASLYDATTQLSGGAQTLDGGIGQLQAGIAQVQGGLHELNAKSAMLTGGSTQVYDGLKQIQQELSAVSASADDLQALSSASSQIKTGIDTLAAGAQSLYESTGYDRMKAVMAQKGLDVDALQASNTQTIAALTEQITQLQAQLTQISGVAGYEAQAAQLQAQVESLSGIVKLLTGNNAYIEGTASYFAALHSGAQELSDGLANLQTSYAQFYAGVQKLTTEVGVLMEKTGKLTQAINQLTTAYGTLHGGMLEYTGAVAKLSDGSDAIAAAAVQIKAGSQTLATGTVALHDGAAKLSDGTGALLGGATQVSSGADALAQASVRVHNGVVTLSDGSKALVAGLQTLQGGGVKLHDGVAQLLDGAKALKDGLAQFQEEAAQPLSEKSEVLFHDVLERVKALQKNAADYKSYSGIRDDMEGSVKFLIETDSIGD